MRRPSTKYNPLQPNKQGAGRKLIRQQIITHKITNIGNPKHRATTNPPKSTHRGALTHDHKVKSLALYRLSYAGLCTYKSSNKTSRALETICIGEQTTGGVSQGLTKPKREREANSQARAGSREAPNSQGVSQKPKSPEWPKGVSQKPKSRTAQA